METITSETFATPFYMLIVAAGRGERLGGEIPKQYRPLLGKPVLRHALETCLSCPGLAGLRVVIDPAHMPLYDAAAEGLGLPPPVLGGNTRSSSVFNGIKLFSDLQDEDFLLIHDAARPFVTQAGILSVVRALTESPAATLAVPVADTMRRGSGGLVGEAMDRTDAFALQTPQGFHYGVIRRAHESSKGPDATDDTALVSALGVPVKLVAGSRRNFKITTPEDMEIAERMMNPETRTGTGFDVHAFTEGSSVRLCGVDIPFERALAGHSDADAGLHALTDALLGTIAAGDIGSHFPPSDPRWKGADSAIFLREAARLVAQRWGRIVHLDLTIVCEAPKIGPHREAMRARISDILEISMDQVSVKATTTEGLGFTGRGEGIAVQAVASCAFAIKVDQCPSPGGRKWRGRVEPGEGLKRTGGRVSRETKQERI